MIFDLIQIVAALAYMTCLTVGIHYDRQDATAHRAIVAFLLTALSAYIGGLSALMRVDANGWVPVQLAGLFLVGAVVVITVAVADADRIEASR